MRLVVSLSLMGLSIEPEASSTSTMSSGVVEVDFAFEVGEGVESAVMNAESPRSVAVSLLYGNCCVSCCGRMAVVPSSAKAKLLPRHIRASAKTIASNGRIRFIFDPQSCFRLLINVLMLPSLQHQGIFAYHSTHFCHAIRGIPIGSSQMQGTFVTGVYTNTFTS